MSLTIPQYKDKVIYIPESETRNAFSYYVSSSYKGILRLSPNDTYSVTESSPIGDSYLYGTSGDDYRDNVESDIQKQFVRVSTSDGYFVNWRLSKDGTEFDNLYVIGPAFQGILRVYSQNKEAIIFDNVNYLPAQINHNAILENSDKKILVDTIEPELANSLDNTYILTSNSKISKKRKFTYEQLRGLIKTSITKKFTEQDTIPTGSIQYVPVNLKQYKALINKGHYPNRYKTTNNKKTDPIVRDYLLCDGSLYRNIDFPELAKALYMEKISWWKPEDKNDGSKPIMKLQEPWINDYEGKDEDEDDDDKDKEKEKEKCFRVPDLRRMFIKSVYLTNNEADINDPNAPWTDTGQWTNDSRPKDGSDGNKKDYHRHFITSAHYQAYPLCNKMGDAEMNAKVKVKYHGWDQLKKMNGVALFNMWGGPLGAVGGSWLSGEGAGWIQSAVGAGVAYWYSGDLMAATNAFGINYLQNKLSNKYYTEYRNSYSVARKPPNFKNTNQDLLNPVYGSAVLTNEDKTEYVLNTNISTKEIEDFISSRDVERKNDEGEYVTKKETFRGRASILAPTNNMSEFVWPAYGDHYRTGRYEKLAEWAGVPMLPAGYFLSIPKEFDFHSFDEKQDANAVISSEDITSCLVDPTSDDDISYEINGNKPDEHNEYVDFINDKEGEFGKNTYGYENVPEYFAMLPLIKI